MLDAVIPSLKLEGMVLGPKATGIDLRLLLYKGGASLDRHWGQRKLDSGELGRQLMERLPLLEAILQRWQTAVTDRSLSPETIDNEWSSLKKLVAFADRTNAEFTKANAMRLYLAWADQVAARSDLRASSKYNITYRLASVIGPIIGVKRKILHWKTKICWPQRLGASGAKENLSETAAFIQLLHETIRQLAVDVVRGPLPVILRYGEVEYQINCGRNAWKPIGSHKRQQPCSRARQEARLKRALEDTSHTKRAMLINLRLEAEMLVFINQTSGNLTQVLQLTGGKFRYQSKGDYVYMRPWKDRANHAVEFRIEKGYRPHFERFLKWREAIFPGDPEGLTFPFVCNDGDKAKQRTAWAFNNVRRLCNALGRPFVNSRQQRKTPANFTKRRASREVAAELLSNSQKTFQQNYEEANHQQAVAELVNFFDTLKSIVVDAVGPGACQRAGHDPVPEQVPDAPRGAPKPDCEGGAGCLFCPKNRDLRSFDHAWNLASLQHLALLQLNADHTNLSLKEDHPSLVTAERAAAKLGAMEREDGECAGWVAEARLRVKEGRYHPHYIAKFESLEGVV